MAGKTNIKISPSMNGWTRVLIRKEVIHPQLRLGIPCYDLSLIINLYLTHCFLFNLGTISETKIILIYKLALVIKQKTVGFDSYRLCCLDGRCVQDPITYSPRPADPRLLPIPTSRGRVSDLYLN